jgi:hypothetical protein
MATDIKTTKKSDGYYDELVTIKLFKDSGKYADDVYVAVNGVGMIVPRGKEVQIPRKYAIVLQNSEAQDAFAASYIADQIKKSEKNE